MVRLHRNLKGIILAKWKFKVLVMLGILGTFAHLLKFFDKPQSNEETSKPMRKMASISKEVSLFKNWYIFKIIYSFLEFILKITFSTYFIHLDFYLRLYLLFSSILTKIYLLHV